MKYSLVKKWLLRLTLVLIAITIVSSIFANYELKHMFGGYTEIVDTTPFNIDAKPTVITNVNILSPNGNHFIENQTIILNKGKIIFIGETDEFPKNNFIINGKDK